MQPKGLLQAENVVTDTRPAPDLAQHIPQAFDRLAKALRGLPEAPVTEAAAGDLLATMDLAPQVTKLSSMLQCTGATTCIASCVHACTSARLHFQSATPCLQTFLQCQ